MKRAWVTVRMTQESLDLIYETLLMDSKSSMFAPELREEIKAALEEIEFVKREMR